MTHSGPSARFLNTAEAAMPARSRLSVLVVDLNNFASFPTLAVGILTAAMRGRGHAVKVLCPLVFGVPPTMREHRETLMDHGRRRIHLSDWSPFLGLRDLLRRLETRRVERAPPAIVEAVAGALEDRPNAILISAYLQHFNSVADIARLARDRGIPVILGGPMFNLPEVAETWRALPGISAVVGAEIDRDLPDLVEALCRGGMIRGIAKGIGNYVPGAEWVGTVHVDERKDNGLSRADLEAAVEGGMRRISFGLETGSQRLLEAMRKGSSVERNATFIRDAHAAGLSIRSTMFKGFPGETAEDMRATADFLEEHAPYLDRVRFNDFTLHAGTPIWNQVTANSKAEGEPALFVTDLDDRRARAAYRRTEARSVQYRKEKARALRAVFEINRKTLRDSARQFDGLM